MLALGSLSGADSWTVGPSGSTGSELNHPPRQVRAIFRWLAVLPAAIGWTYALLLLNRLIYMDLPFRAWLEFGAVVCFSLTFTYASVSGRVPHWLFPRGWPLREDDQRD